MKSPLSDATVNAFEISLFSPPRVTTLKPMPRAQHAAPAWLLILFLFTACEAPQSSGQTAAQLSFDAEFAAIMKDYFEAWTISEEEGNHALERASECYAQDSEFRRHARQPGAVENHLQPFFDAVSSLKRSPLDDLQVRREANSVWTSCTCLIQLRLKNGETRNGEGRHTATWKREDGRWRITEEIPWVASLK